jgi:hypothetical protein
MEGAAMAAPFRLKNGAAARGMAALVSPFTNCADTSNRSSRYDFEQHPCVYFHFYSEIENSIKIFRDFLPALTIFVIEQGLMSLAEWSIAQRKRHDGLLRSSRQ